MNHVAILILIILHAPIIYLWGIVVILYKECNSIEYVLGRYSQLIAILAPITVLIAWYDIQTITHRLS